LRPVCPCHDDGDDQDRILLAPDCARPADGQRERHLCRAQKREAGVRLSSALHHPLRFVLRRVETELRASDTGKAFVPPQCTAKPHAEEVHASSMEAHPEDIYCVRLTRAVKSSNHCANQAGSPVASFFILSCALCEVGSRKVQLSRAGCQTRDSSLGPASAYCNYQHLLPGIFVFAEWLTISFSGELGSGRLPVVEQQGIKL
jgi:hypothetical protein